MNLLVGTSGYSCKEWKGGFYPEDLPDSEMLRYYGTQLPRSRDQQYLLPSPPGQRG